MDLHVLIVIACVFLASLSFLLLINKFFRGKTFEEVAAEKKLFAEKLYGPSKIKRQQQQRKLSAKKEIKKDKKMKLKENSTTVNDENLLSVKDNNNEIESQNESDIHSETQSESSPLHKKETHVEFLEPEVIEDNKVSVSASATANRQSRPFTNNSKKDKQQLRKTRNSSKSPGTGILVNKSEPVVINEILAAEPLNHFDINPPKDVIELKKTGKEENTVDGKVHQTENKQLKEVKVKDVKKITKPLKKDDKEKDVIQQQTQELTATKEIKQNDEKNNKNHDSPKNSKQHKKKKMENSLIEQMNWTDLISVNSLITIFNNSELNRNEIQILIDYLLNKQQDTPAHHSEWSDDIVQKLKKQLNEKEKALQEEQEASAGIQAKLRDLRTEINTERVHFNATTKMYMEKMQLKETEIIGLTQEIQNLSEKLNLERQQFQAKLRHEKQAGSQELLAQIQQLSEHNNNLQSEVVRLQMIANASHQSAEETKQKTNDIIQQQNNQILTLEQKLGEANEEIAHQQYELQLKQMVENEKENNKVEIRNLQNALDSKQAELNLAQAEIKKSKSNLDALNMQIEQFKSQLDIINTRFLEQTQNYEQLKIRFSDIQHIVTEKDKKLTEYEVALDKLKKDEDDLIRQINEQKEKNNELRTKNWKLVEALQKAETTNPVTTSVNKNANNLVIKKDNTSKDEQRIRELFNRLFPEATNTMSASSLSLSFDEWIEQVVSVHIKQYINSINKDNISSSKNNKNNLNILSEENNGNNNSNKNSCYTSNHIVDKTVTESCSNNCTSNYEKDKNDEETKQIMLENYQLKAKVEQLTSIVTKTENLLTNLETQARDQETHWRNVVQSKQEEIHLLKNLLKNTNGQAI